MKSVLISIQPKWCELIANGKKTVEVRKTKPKLETPFKVYIYCTKNKKQWLRKVSNFVREIFVTENKDVIGRTDKVKSLIGDWTTFVENGGYNGKVIGEFVCDRIYEIGYDYFYPCGYEVSMGEISRKELYEKSCLSFNQIDDYLNMELGYGWHISDLVIYDKPRELGEFYNECEKIECDDCPHLHFENTPNSYEGWCEFDEKIPITRPPQSWCYVESIDNAICKEIRDMAVANGIDDVCVLDKKNILAALQKQIPKKPIVHGYREGREINTISYTCPMCNEHIGREN